MTIAAVSIVLTSIIYAIIINLIFILLFSRTIGLWGIFSKMGIPEWKSLIPVYSQIVLLKELQISPWCTLLYLDFLIPIIGSFLGRDATWAFWIVMVGFIIYKYIIAIRLGESFKKGTVFGFFLAFFPSILYPVLGCAKKEEYTKIPRKKVKEKK